MTLHTVILKEDPATPVAQQLIDELSDALSLITGDSGRESFDFNDINDPRALFVVAYDEQDNALGCGALRPVSDTIGEVKRMYSKPERRGKGVGKAILTYLEKQAQAWGYEALWLETRLINHQAVAFYERRGYHRIPNYGKYVSRPEAVCFEKRLLNIE